MLFNKYADVGWILALRLRNKSNNLFEGNFEDEFKIIKNPWRYWCADPFLFEYNEAEYIFCEAYDILQEKGVIAYRRIKNGKISKLRVCLECDYHLSYPYIFKYNHDIYMVPETCAKDRIEVFRAVKFPDKWEKCDDLLKNTTACDTNFVKTDDGKYMLTLIFDKSKDKYVYDKLFMYYWNGQEFSLSKHNPVVVGSDAARNAGKMFKYKGTLYRVAQNCSKSYGENLSFFAVKEINKHGYAEELYSRVYVNDIKVNMQGFDGIHTYNSDEKYEIIDLKKEKWFRMARILYLIKNKFLKIIRRKA